MRWALWVVLGVALAVVGVVGLGDEISHGRDVWARSDTGMACLVLGAMFVWGGLSERANGVDPESRIWPKLALLGVLAAIGLVLYLIMPGLAVLFAILVVPFGLSRWAPRV